VHGVAVFVRIAVLDLNGLMADGAADSLSRVPNKRILGMHLGDFFSERQ
jgi:hypothetical protein